MNEKLYGIYKHTPPSIQNFLVSAYGLYLYRLKYGGAHKGYLNTLMETGLCSRESLAELQLRELKGLIGHAYLTVPYYKNLFNKVGLKPRDINEISDLSKIPVLEREMIRRKPGLFLSSRFKGWQLVKDSTSGSTGTPVTVFFNKEAIRKEFAFLRRREEALGIKPRAKRAIFRGSLVVPYKQTPPPFWRYDAFENSWHFSSHHMSENNMIHYYNKLRRIRPEMIIGYPSSIYTMARYIVENDLDRVYPKAVLPAAETLLIYQRGIIEKAFGPNVFDSYGNTEMSIHMSQCRKKSYHIDSEYGIAELVDKNNKGIGFGQPGELVGTGFCNYAMPLIRYKTGDIAVFSDQECPCGSGFPVVSKILGRLDDLIVTPEGRHVGRMDPAFKGLVGIKEAQVIQESLRAIVVKVVRGKEYSEETEQGLIYNLKERLGGRISVRIDYIEKVPRDESGKFKAVISRLGIREPQALYNA